MAGRRAPLGLKGALGAAIVGYGICIFFVFTGLNAHSQAEKSSFVQAHGIQDNATIISVDNIAHHSKHSTTYTAQVTVQLQYPVDRTTSSIVYVPNQDNSNPGDTISVLVDPNQPSYSELPGSPNTTTFDWIWPLVIAAALFVWGAVMTHRFVVLYLRQRGPRLATLVTSSANRPGPGEM